MAKIKTDTPVPSAPLFTYSGRKTFVLVPDDAIQQRTVKDLLQVHFAALEIPPTIVPKLPVGLLTDLNVVYAATVKTERGQVSPGKYGPIVRLHVSQPFVCKDYSTEDVYGLAHVDVPRLVDAIQADLKGTGVCRVSGEKNPTERVLKVFGT